MSQSQQLQEQNKTNLKPKYLTLYQVDDFTRNGEIKSSFTKLGVAFLNSDNSFMLHLNATPMAGNILMRPAFSRMKIDYSSCENEFKKAA